MKIHSFMTHSFIVLNSTSVVFALLHSAKHNATQNHSVHNWAYIAAHNCVHNDVHIKDETHNAAELSGNIFIWTKVFQQYSCYCTGNIALPDLPTYLNFLPHLPTYLQKTLSTIQTLNKAVSQFLRCFFISSASNKAESHSTVQSSFRLFKETSRLLCCLSSIRWVLNYPGNVI